MKDRVVEFPNRYRIVPVKGESDIVDLIPVPGEVTEQGTLMNKAALLSDATAALYCLSPDATVNEVLRHGVNLSSFQAFVTKANTDSLDAAFGKNNEDRIYCLGLQMAMYAWFKGERAAFEKLVKQNTLEECYANAYSEILACKMLKDLIAASPYANADPLSPAVIKGWKKDYEVMRQLINNAEIVNRIRDTAVLHDAFHSGRVVLDTIGEGSFIVPEGVDCLTVCAIGGGENGGGGRQEVHASDKGNYFVPGPPGGRGGYFCKVYKVSAGDAISYKVGGSGEASIFGSDNTGNIVNSVMPQNGCLLKVSGSGGTASAIGDYQAGIGAAGGGIGGIGGGDGAAGSPVTHGSGNSGSAAGKGPHDIGDKGGGGAGRWWNHGGGGGGYGGGGGADCGTSQGGTGGQGAIAIFM